MNRNALFLLIGLLIAGVAVLGYQLYEEKKQPDGVEISVGGKGLSIKEK